MKAPEKIYLTKNLLGELFDGWDALPSNDFINIEYTRTDAFIEKATDWLEQTLEPYIPYCNIDTDLVIEKFKIYMEG